jgi:SAM-dependent methyltransferase
MNQTRLKDKIRQKSLTHILAFIYAQLMVKRILKTIDLDEFKIFYERYKEADTINEGYSKYLDLPTWMKENLIPFHMLNLHKSRPLKILDLGTGTGYFPYICSLYGHEVIALDLDIVPMYNELCQFFNINRKTHRIMKYENLPNFGVKFDLITAFMIKFNQHNQSDQWHVNEWQFFLKDLINNQLMEKGRVFLQLNANRDGSYYDDQLLKMYLDFGGRVYNRCIDIGGPKPNFVLNFFDHLLASNVIYP